MESSSTQTFHFIAPEYFKDYSSEVLEEYAANVEKEIQYISEGNESHMEFGDHAVDKFTLNFHLRRLHEEIQGRNINKAWLE